MEGGRDLGLGSQLALQRQAALGVGRNSDQDQGPHCFLCWELPIPQAWEGLHKKTALSLLLPTSGAQGGKGRADPALAMWGAYQRIQGHGVGEGKLTLCFLPRLGLGSSSSCNHFYLILLCVVHGHIYLLSDDALQLWSVYLRRDCILKESITQY